MHRENLPPVSIPIGPSIKSRREILSPKEILWRATWPYAFTMILASVMLVLTVIIIALETANLTVDQSSRLSNTGSTGAGFWCSISFIVALVFMYLLVLSYESSHRWSTYTLITHFIALLFILVLIALDANAVTPYNNQLSSAPVKIQILKAQLAVAVLLLFCPLSFLGAYIYTAFMSLFPFRPHTESVYPPLPIRSPKVGF